MIKEGQIIKLLKREDVVDCPPGIASSMDKYFGKYQSIKKHGKDQWVVLYLQ